MNAEEAISANALHFVDDVAAVVAELADIRTRMRDSEGGLRASSYEPRIVAGSPVDTVTSSLFTLDDVEQDRWRLVAALASACDVMREALRICARYPRPHVPDADELAAIARENERREGGCESCARTRRPDGERRFEPIYSQLTEATTVGDRLDEAMLLCRWCYDRTSAWGRLPNVDELERHHRGERVPWPSDVERT